MILDFDFVEESDNSKVTLTDTTLDYGTNQIQAVYNTGTAIISLEIRGVMFDDINVKSYFNGNNQSNLVFDITAEMLMISGEAQYSIGDDIPDGDYLITYSVNDGVGDADTEVQEILVYGVVEEAILEEIRIISIPIGTDVETLYRALIRGAWNTYLQAIINSAYVGETENIRTALSNLEIMIENGVYS